MAGDLGEGGRSGSGGATAHTGGVSGGVVGAAGETTGEGGRGGEAGGAPTSMGGQSGDAGSGGSAGENVGGAGGDGAGGCGDSACGPVTLAELAGERVRTIGLSPESVLVSSDKWVNGGAAIYTVNRSTGAVKMTRPRRTDGSFSSRLWGTESTLVSLDVYQAAATEQFLSHCSVADCRDAVPSLDSHMPNLIFDFAVDEINSRAYWFDPTTRELMSTLADTWAPTAAGTITAPPQSAGDERATTFASGMVYVALTDWIAKVAADANSAVSPLQAA